MAAIAYFGEESDQEIEEISEEFPDCTNDSEDLIEEEKTEMLLVEIRHYLRYSNEATRNVIITEFPNTASVFMLEKVLKLICNMVFSPSTIGSCPRPAACASLCERCKQMKIEKFGEVEQRKTREEILISTILVKLKERFCYKRKLKELARMYKGPNDKKEKWVCIQSEKLERYYSNVDSGSRSFLLHLYLCKMLTNETLYKLIQTNPSEESLNYFYELLKEIGQMHIPLGQKLLSDISWLFKNVDDTDRVFFEKNKIIPMPMKSSFHYQRNLMAVHSLTRVENNLSLSEERLERQANTILQEFLEGHISIEVVIEEIKKIYLPLNRIGIFIETVLKTSLQERPGVQRSVGKLLSTLITYKVFSSVILRFKLRSFYRGINEFAIDAPKVWELQAQLIVPLLTSEKINFMDLKVAWSSILRTDTVVKILIPIFNLLVEEEGVEFVRNIWVSNLMFKDYLPNHVDVQALIKRIGM